MNTRIETETVLKQACFIIGSPLPNGPYTRRDFRAGGIAGKPHKHKCNRIKHR